ncbi:MAG: hypothetical protein GF388_01820 [Candidatus Aegiribacteria sp.]|nr:hypothetical protein [Candidatus Aegiribacteria sp.]
MSRASILLIIMCTSLLAAGDGDYGVDTSACRNPQVGTDITFTETNTWEITTGGNVLGLDFKNSGTPLILYGSNVNSHIESIYPSSGAPGPSVPLSSGNIGAFGVSWSNDTAVEFYFANDYIYADIFITGDSGSSWNSIGNPAGSDGRGIDASDGILWQASSNISSATYINRLELESSQNTVYQITEPQAQLSGLTLCEYSGNPSIAVTTYSDGNIYIYELTGRGINYSGSGSIPITFVSCYGLTYDPLDDLFYISYIDDEDRYYITELEYTTVSLQRNTFGGIKALLGS